MQGAPKNPVPGLDRANDDVFERGREGEVGALEFELSLDREEMGFVGSLGGLELDAAEAPGLPVLALREDLAGEDGAGAYGGFEEGEEFLGDCC